MVELFTPPCVCGHAPDQHERRTWWRHHVLMTDGCRNKWCHCLEYSPSLVAIEKWRKASAAFDKDMQEHVESLPALHVQNLSAHSKRCCCGHQRQLHPTPHSCSQCDCTQWIDRTWVPPSGSLRPKPKTMEEIVAPTHWSPKWLSEKLAAHSVYAPDEFTRRKINELLDVLELHRPTGCDGKHGDLHTPTCGCEDK